MTKAKRKAKLSPQQRFRALHRCGFACYYCGARPPQVWLTIDHLVPLSQGGSVGDDSNLVAACPDCNTGKGSDVLDGDVALPELSIDTDAVLLAIEVLERADRGAVRALLELDGSVERLSQASCIGRGQLAVPTLERVKKPVKISMEKGGTYRCLELRGGWSQCVLPLDHTGGQHEDRMSVKFLSRTDTLK